MHQIFRAPHAHKCSTFQRLKAPDLFGYVPFRFEHSNSGRPTDLVEGYSFVHSNHQLHCRQDLRGLPSHIDDTLRTLWEASSGASKAVCDALELAMGLQKGYFYEPMESMEMTNLRFNYYPGGKSDCGAIARGEHVDTSAFTVLVADRGGLQVRPVQCGREGGDGRGMEEGEFVEVNGGMVLVLAGDLLSRWSNGRWKGALHKVVHDEERCSLAIFFHPGRDYVVRADQVFLKGEERLYKDVKVGEYLDRRFYAVWNEKQGEEG